MIKHEGFYKTGVEDPKDYLDENVPRKEKIMKLNEKLAPEIEAYRTAHGYPEFPELQETLSINNKKLYNIVNQPAPAPAPLTRLSTAPVMPTSTIPQAGAGRPTEDALQKAIMSIAPVPQSGAGITHTTPKSRGATSVHSRQGEYVPPPRQASAFGSGPAYASPPTSAPPKKQK